MEEKPNGKADGSIAKPRWWTSAVRRSEIHIEFSLGFGSGIRCRREIITKHGVSTTGNQQTGSLSGDCGRTRAWAACSPNQTWINPAPPENWQSDDLIEGIINLIISPYQSVPPSLPGRLLSSFLRAHVTTRTPIMTTDVFAVPGRSLYAILVTLRPNC